MRHLKGGKLFLYSMAGLGPNLLMTLVTGYLNDALLAPVGIDPAKTFTGTVLVSAGLCSLLFFFAKLIDAVIDVPLAYINDRMHCRLGKRKLGILLGWVPMVISFFFLWNPTLFGGLGMTCTAWVESVLLVVFYSSYTMCMVSYYGTFSQVVSDDKARMKLSHFKAFFDTVQYCVAYALFPALLLALLGGREAGAVADALTKLMPLMLTMLIPVFLLHENEGGEDKIDDRVPLLKSIRLSVGSRSFRSWLITLFFMHMGLMLFLTGIGTTIPDSLMGIKGWQVTVMNSAAFAPVPLMLLLFNAYKKRRGDRAALQSALLAFAVAMFGFAFASKQIWNNAFVSFLIGVTAATIGSYAVGVFFSMSYYFPSRIAAREIREEKRDHSSMYFAVQGLATQVASAIGVSLLYMNIVGSDFSLFGIKEGQFMYVPLLAGVLMIAAFVSSFLMDKNAEG